MGAHQRVGQLVGGLESLVQVLLGLEHVSARARGLADFVQQLGLRLVRTICGVNTRKEKKTSEMSLWVN
jgi:hypothetical protein